MDGGAGEEHTLRANRDSFSRQILRPRALAGLTSVDLSTTILGTRVDVPFFVCPMAYQASVHSDGELATARAAAGAGALAIFSTLSSASLEAIAGASGAGPRWFQLYLQPEMEENRALLQRAQEAGYSAIVLTVDLPILGIRDAQLHHGFALDASPPLGNGAAVLSPQRAAEFTAGGFRLRADAAHGWEVLGELRQHTNLPLVVKGVLTGEDAKAAVDHGARAVIVSNHGGRQLDHAPASLEALPEVAAAVGHRAEVYLDSGVRRGADIIAALALGARAVGVGRPVLWALAVGGESGVREYLAMLREELAVTFALMGRSGPGDTDGSALGSLRRGDPGP